MIIMSNRVQTMRLGALQKQLETLQQEKEKEREETSAVTLGIGIEWHLIGEEGNEASGEAWLGGHGGHLSSV